MIDEFHKVDDGTTLWSNDKNYYYDSKHTITIRDDN